MKPNNFDRKQFTKAYRLKIQTDLGFLQSKAHLFWAHVDKRLPNECWDWIGKTVNGNGGRFGSWNDMTATRVAVALKIGRLLRPDEHVEHQCPDNPRCVNPEHLSAVQNWMHYSKCLSCKQDYRSKPAGCALPQHREFYEHWRRVQ